MEARGSAQVFEEAAIDLGRALAAYAEARSSKGSPRGRRQVGFPLRKKKGHCRDSFRLRAAATLTGRITCQAALPRSGESHPTAVALLCPSRQRSSKLPARGSSQLVKTHDRLCLEDLAVANLIRNKYLARAIGDAGWAELARQVTYTQAWRGGQVLVADRWFPSTRICSRCGLVKQRMGLADRVFRCDRCGMVMGRDRNAAANLAA
jgi:putative transposase-like DNA-binding protein